MSTFSDSNHFTRRRFLKTSAAGAAAAVVAGAGAANAQSSLSSGSSSAPAADRPRPQTNPRGELPFSHGVASGDPLPETVILWTRVSANLEALPGSGAGPDIPLAWEVSTDRGFTGVVKRGTAVASAAHDHTVHVDPWGLDADTEYFFRFIVTGGEHTGVASPTGRTHTAPNFGAGIEAMNIAVASCANWESGYFSAYTDVANRAHAGDVDLMVFLGDYIYEYGQGEYSGNGPFRLMEPAHEIITLADYRTRYGLYRSDAELQAAHGALPWVVVWDDHEIANNNWSGGAENHDPATEGPWAARRDAAMQAYFEWLPIRATSPSRQGHLYRSFQYGDLVELTMMDLRTYRDQEGGMFDIATFNDPSRTMLGGEQAEWLRGKIATSSTTWNVLGNSVMFSPMYLATLRGDQATSSVADFLTEHRISGLALNSDQWDGYGYAQQQLLKLLAEKGSNALFLTGDIHTEWAHSVSYGGREFGCELVTSSVSAPNVDEILGLPRGNAVSDLAEDLLRVANPRLKHVELDSHGYAIARVRRDEVTMQFLRTPDVTKPGAGVAVAHEMVWRSGQGFV